jgi:hypothetical protein
MRAMTPEELEQAARLVCEKRGVDPDGMVVNGTAAGSFYIGVKPRWSLIALDVKQHYEFITSIATVLDMEKVE